VLQLHGVDFHTYVDAAPSSDRNMGSQDHFSYYYLSKNKFILLFQSVVGSPGQSVEE